MYLVVLAVIFVVFLLPALFAFWREERDARAELANAIATGRHEPLSIRPWVDPDRCVGCATCVTACPEGKILRVIDGLAVVVASSSCVGHGACEAACPTEALELVFGSDRRGVDIPAVSPDFQSNVPGLYIAGELGGMGLIANAVEQGRQAMEHIRRSKPSAPQGGLDVVVIGAGPAGVSAGLQAASSGLSHLVIEQSEHGGAIRQFPRKKLIMTRGFELPGVAKVPAGTLSKEELIAICERAVAKFDMVEGESVLGVTPVDGHFEVRTSKQVVRAARVLLSVGRRGTPRKLGVPGEDAEKVAYRLIEPEEWQYSHVLVVGGGDSAVEAAVALGAQPGNRVTLSYRQEQIQRPRPQNQELLRAAVERGEVSLLLGSTVTAITGDRARLVQGGEQVVIPNDRVFVFIGGLLPTGLLTECGIEVQRHFGKRVEAAEKPGS